MAPSERFPAAVEQREERRYADRLFTGRVIGRDAEHIERTAAIRVIDGKEKMVPLSSDDGLLRDGWDPHELSAAVVGGAVINISGEVFLVKGIAPDRITVEHRKTGEAGTIERRPRNVRGKEYRYRVPGRKNLHVYDLAYRDGATETAELIDDLVGAIPAPLLDCIREIRIDRETPVAEGRFRMETTLFSKKGIVTIHLDPEHRDRDRALKTLYHELAHAMVVALMGSADPGARWAEAARKDANEVSSYAAEHRREGKNFVEDIAEAAMLYFASDGAKGDRSSALRSACENRFALLDAIMDSMRERAMDRNLVRQLWKRLVSRERHPLSL